MEHSFSVLLEAYRSLWKNRSLTTEKLNEKESQSLPVDEHFSLQ